MYEGGTYTIVFEFLPWPGRCARSSGISNATLTFELTNCIHNTVKFGRVIINFSLQYLSIVSCRAFFQQGRTATFRQFPAS